MTLPAGFSRSGLGFGVGDHTYFDKLGIELRMAAHAVVHDDVRTAAARADRLRLGLIENLSTFFNALFGVVVLIVLLWIAAMFFAVALTWVIGMLIGSMLGAILLMGGLFVVLAAIVYAVRRRLIVDQMARMFGKMVYDMRKKHSDDE